MTAELLSEILAFLAVFPEFKDIAIERIGFVFNNSTARIDESIWGDFTLEARYLLTAHQLTSMNAGNVLGGVIDKIRVEGDIEIESSVEFKPKDSLDLTSYGREFNRLKSAIVGGFITCT